MTDIVTIAFTGYAGSGKDTCAEIIKNSVRDINWNIISFSDPLFDSLEAVDPIIAYEEEEKTLFFCTRKVTKYARLSEILKRHNDDRVVVKNKYPEVRRLLQRLGTEGGRNIHGQGCWVEIMRKRIIDIISKERSNKTYTIGFIFVNIRFINELNLSTRIMNGTLIHVTRPGVKPALNHMSDMNVDRIKRHRSSTIVNETTTEDPLKSMELKSIVMSAIKDGLQKRENARDVLDKLSCIVMQDM